MAVQRHQIVYFLIGFYSQAHKEEAYDHFIGTNPQFRKQKIGGKLYQLFFEMIAREGKEWVNCVTSPANKTSIAFHKRIGFEIVEGNSRSPENISYFKDYDGEEQDRVLFRKRVSTLKVY